MYSSFQLAKKYLHYFLAASNGKGHGIHSPFVFDFITKVLNDKEHYPAYDLVESLRNDLLKDQTILEVQDFGAGSVTGKSNQRTISSIAKNAAKPAKYGQLLFRIIQRYQPKTILELGTSLGITTSYISQARSASDVITMEGSPSIAAIAKRNFEKLQLKNIKTVEGNFDNTLPPLIEKLSSIAFAFLDGNHRREPTINYFNMILPKTNSSSIIVVDDIHWSREMEKAWQTIKNNPGVKCSVDLFFIGIVFFKDDFREKQDFVIRF